MFSSWNQKTSVEPDILALAKAIDKEGSNFSQAIAQSAVGVALEILGPAAILARDIDNLPGAKADSNKYSRHIGGKFNDLLSPEEATALINDLAKSEYCSAPLNNMTSEQCASLYQTMVVNVATKLVKSSLKKDSQFLTDKALDDVAQAVVQRNISSNMSYQSSLRPQENKLYQLNKEIEKNSPLKDDYDKISKIWGPVGLGASWSLVATTANANLAKQKSGLAKRNFQAAEANFQNSLEQTRQQLSNMHSINSSASQAQLSVERQAIISADTLQLNIDFKEIEQALPQDFGFNPLGIYNAAIEFAQADFKLSDRMMNATKSGFTFKK